jgi:hypothetical protein
MLLNNNPFNTVRIPSWTINYLWRSKRSSLIFFGVKVTFTKCFHQNTYPNCSKICSPKTKELKKKILCMATHNKKVHFSVLSKWNTCKALNHHSPTKPRPLKSLGCLLTYKLFILPSTRQNITSVCFQIQTPGKYSTLILVSYIPQNFRCWFRVYKLDGLGHWQELPLITSHSGVSSIFI